MSSKRTIAVVVVLLLGLLCASCQQSSARFQPLVFQASPTSIWVVAMDTHTGKAWYWLVSPDSKAWTELAPAVQGQ